MRAITYLLHNILLVHFAVANFLRFLEVLLHLILGMIIQLLTLALTLLLN